SRAGLAAWRLHCIRPRPQARAARARVLKKRAAQSHLSMRKPSIVGPEPGKIENHDSGSGFPIPIASFRNNNGEYRGLRLKSLSLAREDDMAKPPQQQLIGSITTKWNDLRDAKRHLADKFIHMPHAEAAMREAAFRAVAPLPLTTAVNPAPWEN